MTTEGRVAIRDFVPADAQAFRDINVAWIERYFTMEPKDWLVLDNPGPAILDKGGAILMADVDGRTVGCCALIAMEDDCVELAKMGVTDAAQGKGVGRGLVAEAVQRARAMGAKRIYLETNSALGPALKLYADAGFVRVMGPPSPYARADVQMELLLD